MSCPDLIQVDVYLCGMIVMIRVGHNGACESATQVNEVQYGYMILIYLAILC